jgi:DNA-binding response OmpR family regulator
MRILFVDNHAEFTATVVERFLRVHQVTVVPTIAAAKVHVGTSTFDVVLVDDDLDAGKGDELVTWMRSSEINVKIVAVSARESGNEALISAGADVACAKLAFSKIQTVLEHLQARFDNDILVTEPNDS